MPPLDPTPRRDYAHWNEEQDLMWWDEVGRHAHQQMEEPPEPDPSEYMEYDDLEEEDLD